MASPDVPPPPPSATLVAASSTPHLQGEQQNQHQKPTPTMMQRTLAILVSYPTLLQHEEQLNKSPHSVRKWYECLLDIENIRDTLQEKWILYTNSQQQQQDNGGGGSALSKLASTTTTTATTTTTTRKRFKAFEVGGGHVITQLHSIPHKLYQLQTCQIVVHERSLALLPGSYKLWKMYLAFRINCFTNRLHKIITKMMKLGDTNGSDCGTMDVTDTQALIIMIISTVPTTTTSTTKSNTRRRRKKKQIQKLMQAFLSTQSALERSMVRMNKMPKLWEMYLQFMTLYCPLHHACQIYCCYYYFYENNNNKDQQHQEEQEQQQQQPPFAELQEASSLPSWITTIRHLYDRALCSLPVTQHDKIWKYYIQWITTTRPSTNINTFAATTLRQEEGQLLNNRSSGAAVDNDGDLNEEDVEAKQDFSTSLDIPVESRIRVLRRYVHSYNPSYREDLAYLCCGHHMGGGGGTSSNDNNEIDNHSRGSGGGWKRYNEAAMLLIHMLNDENFVSSHGTTKHELWMILCNLCTRHADEVTSSSSLSGGGLHGGVDFESIIRAALSSTYHQSFSPSPSSLDFNKDGGNVETGRQSGGSATKVSSNNQMMQYYGEIEGTLWTKLADYYVRNGEFEMARSIYEESLDIVSKVRDFSIIFDSYSRFIEGSIQAQMMLMEEEGEEEDDGKRDEGDVENKEKVIGGRLETGDDGDETTLWGGEENATATTVDDDDLNVLLEGRVWSSSGNAIDDQRATSASSTGTANDAIELDMARAEYLMERRPLLLNRVLLRQNPHNVGEWLRRSELYLKSARSNSSSEAVRALEEGCVSVKAQYAVNGNPASIWIALAKLHEDSEKVEEARRDFRRVCIDRAYRFKTIDDLAQVWSAWVEMELRLEHFNEALSVVRQAVATPSDYNFHGQQRAGGNKGKGGRIQSGLYRSLRLWNLALDLEESLGGFANAKGAYERCVELGVATPPIILNFANFLEENDYFEESFSAYEKGIALFPFPHPGAAKIWSTYLKVFTKRYGGKKVDRLREMFERCVENCPSENASEFYLLYAKFEESYGLAKRSLGVYERLCTAVSSEEKLNAYQLYIAKAEVFSGAVQTRPIYEAAIAALEDKDAAVMCFQFADLETKLGEIDRARAAITYGSQMADPRRNPDYWKRWHEFEVEHGNEDSFREMLRVKRGVSAAFSTVNYNAAEMGAAEPAGRPKNLTEDEALDMIAKREGVKSKNLPTIGGFVSGKRTATEANLEVLERQAAKLRHATAGRIFAADGDSGEIDIELEDDEEKQNVLPENASQRRAVEEIHTKEIPAAVFGGLGNEKNTTGTGKIGALERLRAAAKEAE